MTTEQINAELLAALIVATTMLKLMGVPLEDHEEGQKILAAIALAKQEAVEAE